MRKHAGISVLLVVLTALTLAVVPAPASTAAEPVRRVDASTGATPNYRTFVTSDLQQMPAGRANYTFLKSQAPYTYFNQDWYGVDLSYLLDVEVGLKAGTTGVKVVGADGYQVQLSPEVVRNPNPQGKYPMLAWKKGAVNSTGGALDTLDDKEGPFRLIVPQSPNVGPHPGGSSNFSLCVSGVRAIEILPTPPGLLSIEAETVPPNEVLVSGNVLNRRSFTIDQLKSIEQFSGKYRSMKSGEVLTRSCTGIPFDVFLDEVVGLLPTAKNLDVVASDGFKETFKFEDVRLRPNGLPFLLAWYADGDLKPEPAGEGPIMAVKPQTSPTDSNRQFWVRNVRSILVNPVSKADAPDEKRIPPDRVIVSGMSDPKNVPVFWYLAEGYTGSGFEEFICVANPNSWETRVIITYMIEGQENQTQDFKIPARTRTTVNVNEVIGPDKNVSATIEGYHGDSITVERAMYWKGRAGGHCAAAVSRPMTEWYLAEGCTANSFETWVLLQNPGESEANVNLTYMNQAGAVPGPSVVLPPKSRKTINVADVLPNDVQVSTKVSSDLPVIAERAMYWANRQAGTCAVGLSRPGNDWFLAEGCTAGGFETWVLVQNPGEEAAKVAFTYMNAGGVKDGPIFDLPGNSRTSINVASTLPDDWQVSTRIESDRPVVAERAVYWSGRAGGHDETAVDSPKFRTLLAEGSTAGGFETWILVQNPGPYDATVHITYITGSGAKLRAPLEIKAGMRVSINASDDVGEDWQVSADVRSSAPVVVERAVYWNGRGGDGSCSRGFTTW